MKLIDTLNAAANNLVVDNINSTLPDSPEEIGAIYESIGNINSFMWMARTICIGKLFDAAVKRGLSEEKAVKDIAAHLHETKMNVRKGARIYSSILYPRISSGHADFPLTTQAYFDIAVKHDKALGQTPLELMEFMENRYFELKSYSPMQAKIDLGLVDDDQTKKFVRHLNGIADADENEIGANAQMIITGFKEKVVKADQILHGLLKVDAQES